MARTKGELQLQARKFGLADDGRCEDLADRLRDYIVKRDNLDILPQIDIMMAQNVKDWLDYSLEKPWTSPKMLSLWQSDLWVAEPKLDGVRVKAHFGEVEKGTSYPRLDSRRRSDVNYVYAEKTENFPHLQLTQVDLGDTILDGELMPPEGITKIWDGVKWIEGLQICTSIWNSGEEVSINLQNYCYLPVTESNLDGTKRGCKMHYWAFDIIQYKGELVAGLPWKQRRACLERVLYEINKENSYYHRTPIIEGDKLAEFERIVESGGEGVMFKNMNSKYSFGKRSWDWLKLKKFVEVSAFIIGSVPSTPGKGWEGLIGAFEVAVMQDGNPVHIASCSAMSLELRKEATGLDKKLNPSFLNRVVEVRFQQLTSRSNRGRHAVMIRFRDDQGPMDCSVDQPGLAVHLSEVQEGA